MPEFLRPAKELLVGARERDMRRELLLQKVKGADEVGNLEEPVTGWLYVNGEFNPATEACLESLMKKPRDRGLSTVIVYLDMVDGRKYFVAQGDEFGERHLEPFDDLLCGIDIPFIHRKAMVSIVNPSGKGHHAGEYPTAQLTAQHGVVLFAANERPCVEAMPLKPDFSVGPFKAVDFVGYVNGLIVKYHADDVKAGFGVGEVEIPRLVYENAQCRCIHGVSPKKREWRDENPATHAESFPRIPVTHAKRRRSVGILAFAVHRAMGNAKKDEIHLHIPLVRW